MKPLLPDYNRIGSCLFSRLRACLISTSSRLSGGTAQSAASLAPRNSAASPSSRLLASWTVALRNTRSVLIKHALSRSAAVALLVASLGSIGIASAQYDEPQSEQAPIVPAHPTHYFYTPTAYVNDPYALVIGLHEISFALPYRLQIQASIFDNIGRLNAGLKYGILDNLSVAAGLAHTLVHVGRGNHGIPEDAAPRFGAFLCYGPITNSTVELGLTPHTQLGDHISFGADLGFKLMPNSFWAIILEVGSSFDATDERMYLNFDGGVRINPPSISFLHFDLGVDLEEFPLVDDVRPTVTVYFDIIFGMFVK